MGNAGNAAEKKQDARFERCPRCGAVVIFVPGADLATCDKCKVKIRIKK